MRRLECTHAVAAALRGTRSRPEEAASLDRYRSLIPDWPAFRAAARSPEPDTIRVRRGRIEPDELRRRLEARGFRLEPLERPTGFFRVAEGPHRISHTLEHWLGLFYLQQAVTGLAAPALGPIAGERILDLCAAPGGKTGHVAEVADGPVSLVAAEPNEKRIRALLGNLYRLAVTDALVVAADGRTFPTEAAFDRVLVDAPCSAEGNLRRFGGEPPRQAPKFLRYVRRVQRDLLHRAVSLTRPGGTVLYVTCTFNPDENEAVVDAVRRELPVRLVPIELDVPHAPGLTRFEGRRFHRELALAWRLYPHHLDSGGLFMARLRVEGAGGEEATEPPLGGSGGGREPVPPGTVGWEPVPPAYPGEDGEAAGRIEEDVGRMVEAFGLPEEALRSARWMRKGDDVWAHRLSGWPVSSWPEERGPRRRGGAEGEWRFVSLGLRALAGDRRFGARPTNDALRWLGPWLRDRVVTLEPEDCRRLLDGEELPADGAPGGLVALRLEVRVIGRGLVSRGRLRHEIPKARARRLARILELGAALSPRSGRAPVR